MGPAAGADASASAGARGGATWGRAEGSWGAGPCGAGPEESAAGEGRGGAAGRRGSGGWLPRGPLGGEQQRGPGSRGRRRRGISATAASTAGLLAVLAGVALVGRARGWVTVDSGQNVTIHAHTNIGPPEAIEKYDLNVFGDLNLGRVDKINPDSRNPDLNVQGSVTTSQLILRDMSSVGVGTSEDEAAARRALLAEHQARLVDFLFVSAQSEFNEAGVQDQKVGFFRQLGAASQTGEEPQIDEVFTVKVGVADLGDGSPNKGHVDVQLAGVSTELQVQSTRGVGNSARLKFVEFDSAEATGETAGELGAGEGSTSYALELSQGALDVRGGRWSMLALEDNRPSIGDEGAPISPTEEALLASYSDEPRAVLSASETGSTLLKLTAPKSRTSDGSFPEGLDQGETHSAIALDQGETSFVLSNVPEADVDVVSFRNHSKSFLDLTVNSIKLMPYDKTGVVIGEELAEGDERRGAMDRDFSGAKLSVGHLDVEYLKAGDVADGAEGEWALQAESVMGLSTKKEGGEDVPLYLSTASHIKADAPFMYVGSGTAGEAPVFGEDGVRDGGAVKLNGTGFTQTALDFPLYLHTHQSSTVLSGEDAAGGNSGVVLSGTYRLQVGGLMLLDTDDGREADDFRATRRITSAGTLRISAFHPDLARPGTVTDFGKEPLGPEGTPEVFIDGNEARGQARFRVGNAVFHDGYLGSFNDVVMDGVHVEDLEILEGVTLIAVGSDRGAAPGAPSDAEGERDPATNIHSGMIVVRSEREVRIDEASRLRVGDPRDSIVVDGRAQAFLGDDGNQSLQLQAALGIELGNSSDGRARYRDRALLDEFPELGTGGHPAMLLRDIELDGCALPLNGSDPVNAYTEGVYARRTQCVSRIGIMPQPKGEQAADWEAAGLLGRYSPESEDASSGEMKELFITSDNYVEFDGRSRVRIGGLFIDGLGQQPEDVENAFSEFRDHRDAEDWSYADGDLKNTIRGDSGVALDGGRQGGDVNITAGSSRDEGLVGGALRILSGGSGAATWEGDSGAATFGSAGVPGNSGAVTITSGAVSMGQSGDVLVGSGDTESSNTTGSLFFQTGTSSAGKAGDITISVGESTDIPSYVDEDGLTVEEGGKRPAGGSVSIFAGNAESIDGGSVDVHGGSSEIMNGGDVSLGAGDSGSPDYTERGGNIDLTAGQSLEGTGGSIRLLAGKSTASQESNPDGWNSGGEISIGTSPSDVAHSGAVSIATGDSAQKIAGSIDIAAGGGALNGANVTLRAGSANDMTNEARFDGSDIAFFTGTRQAITTGYSPIGGELSLSAGSAPGSLGHGGNTSIFGGEAGQYGGHVHLLGGDTAMADSTTHGGSIFLRSGSGSTDSTGDTHSGHVKLQTSSSSGSGGAGSIVLSSGTSDSYYNCAEQHGSEQCIGGNITVAAGTNLGADGAYVSLTAGPSDLREVELDGSTRKTPRGGPVLIEAGFANFGVGGQVNITGGRGSGVPSRETRYSADDNLFEFGEAEEGYGGNVSISGGAADFDHGGNVNLVSGAPGRSDLSTSGNITLVTADAFNSRPAGQTPDGPAFGVSGGVQIRTGEGYSNSGNVTIFTGNATDGDSGKIEIHAGFSESGRGGDVNITAGRGGAYLEGGDDFDVRDDDGDLHLNAGKRVVLNGDLAVELYGGNALDDTYVEFYLDELEQTQNVTYESKNGNHTGGYLLFQGGDSEHSTGGNVTIKGGRGLSNTGGDVDIITGVRM